MGTQRNDSSRLVYTVDEAAVILGLSRNAAYEAVRRDEIPNIRIGRRILIPKQRLDDMLNEEEI